MHAPAKDSSIATFDNVAVLEQYDAFLFGVPTRYGNFPGQWKAFWDRTGSLWQKGALWGKYASFFVSSATMGGGQESTVIAAMSTLAHHGIIYVPLGYKTAFDILGDINEVRGGSPWGAGTFAVRRFSLSAVYFCLLVLPMISIYHVIMHPSIFNIFMKHVTNVLNLFLQNRAQMDLASQLQKSLSLLLSRASPFMKLSQRLVSK